MPQKGWIISRDFASASSMKCHRSPLPSPQPITTHWMRWRRTHLSLESLRDLRRRRSRLLLRSRRSPLSISCKDGRETERADETLPTSVGILTSVAGHPRETRQQTMAVVHLRCVVLDIGI